MRADVVNKLALITFDQARHELLPYLPFMNNFTRLEIGEDMA